MRSVVSRNQMCLLMKNFAPDIGRLRGSLLILSLGALAGCSSTTQYPRYASLGGSGAIDPRYGVRASPRVIADGEEVPKGGGSFMVGKPYKIAGRTYYPSEKPYAATGTASWYGADFHGRRTANGEIFDRQSISAAHPTMPLPSYARVTNLNNARSMVVRVNDRGPYHGGRVMDVSQRVAEALDFHRAGTAKVRVEWIGRADLAGDDDAKLLATLRDDGPATLDSGASIMTAARQGAPAAIRAATAELREAQPVAGASTEEVVRPNESEMMAYAGDNARADPQGGETIADKAGAAVSNIDNVDAEPVASHRHKEAKEAAVPLPPTRPASFGRQASGKPAIRQAMN